MQTDTERPREGEGETSGGGPLQTSGETRGSDEKGWGVGGGLADFRGGTSRSAASLNLYRGCEIRALAML